MSIFGPRNHGSYKSRNIYTWLTQNLNLQNTGDKHEPANLSNLYQIYLPLRFTRNKNTIYIRDQTAIADK